MTGTYFGEFGSGRPIGDIRKDKSGLRSFDIGVRANDDGHEALRPYRLRMGDFKQLKAWQRAQELVQATHTAFKTSQGRDYPGLRSQILRAVASIPATLAEGCAKRSRRELARFAEMAYASAKEVESHLITSRDVEIISAQNYEDLARKTDEVARLCYGLTRLP